MNARVTLILNITGRDYASSDEVGAWVADAIDGLPIERFPGDLAPLEVVSTELVSAAVVS